MKISQTTINLLKNFASINPGLIVKAGSELRTIAPLGQIFACAKIDDEFMQRFAIYDLNSLLGVISLFDDPEIVFADKHLTIKSDNSKIKYVYADESVVMKAPENDPKTAANLVEFNLTQQQLASAQKAAGVMNLEDFSVQVKDGNVTLLVHDQTNPSSHEYRVELGLPTASELTPDAEMRIDFKFENLKVLPATYKAQIHRTLKGRYTLRLDSGKVVYFISSESTSNVVKE